MAEFDDIFDEFRKMMRNPFKGFFSDPFETEDSFFGEINLPENNEKDSRNPTEKKNTKPHTKSYSISYKFGTGMKEPEIHVNGDIDEEDLKNFMAQIPNGFGFPGVENIVAGGVPAAIGAPEKKADDEGYLEPFTDLQTTKDGAQAVFEMPGIGAPDIQIKIDGKVAIITASNGHSKYRKELMLDFKIKSEPIIHANNGIITIDFVRA
jgi:HSP20 family molecular chaperone IbpA